LRQVLLNLLGNAVKFTTAGDVRLTVTREGRDRLRFEVRDTGAGIEPEALTAIFAAFSQTRAGAAAGGTGLGLTISDRLIARMGGRLQVESALGAGSRFWFDLPLVSGRLPAGADRRDELPPLDARLAPGQTLTALVVDDSAANRRILASLLESAGVSVWTASGGLEALELARARRPHVIYMDLKMNDVDGYEATRRLARDPETSSIPVIAVTASALGDVRQAARDAGCVDYLSKPVRAQLLFATLQTHLGARFVSGSEQAPHEVAGQLEAARRAELADRLRSAIAIGDVGAVQALARSLAAGSPPEAALGERIGRLAAGFDFRGLGELADSLGT